jgi:hypothetical protein
MTLKKGDIINIGNFEVTVEEVDGWWGLDYDSELISTFSQDDDFSAYWFGQKLEFISKLTSSEVSLRWGFPYVRSAEALAILVDFFRDKLSSREVYVGCNRGVIDRNAFGWFIANQMDDSTFFLGQDMPTKYFGTLPALKAKLKELTEEWNSRPLEVYIGEYSLYSGSFVNIKDCIGRVYFDSSCGLWFIRRAQEFPSKMWGKRSVEKMVQLLGYTPFICKKLGFSPGFRTLEDVETIAMASNQPDSGAGSIFLKCIVLPILAGTFAFFLSSAPFSNYI